MNNVTITNRCIDAIRKKSLPFLSIITPIFQSGYVLCKTTVHKSKTDCIKVQQKYRRGQWTDYICRNVLLVSIHPLVREIETPGVGSSEQLCIAGFFFIYLPVLLFFILSLLCFLPCLISFLLFAFTIAGDNTSA